MGMFNLRFELDGRVAGCRVQNTWMYRTHDILFTGAYGNPGVSTKWDCALGISGATFQLRGERPVDFSTDDFNIDPRNEIGDYEGDYGNEAGMPSDARACEGYERQLITWDVRAVVGSGTPLQISDWKTWTSRIPWDKLGTDKPSNWDATHPTGPRYHEPHKWSDVQPYENIEQDFPWASPVESDRYWDEYVDEDSVLQPPQSGYPNCPSGVTYGLWGLSGFPLGQVYVAVKRNTDPVWDLLAVAEAHAPAWWRRSGSVSAQYMARWG